MDSPDINSTHSGSHLLSMDTPTFSSESQTGPGGDDLSLSELSISKDSIMNKPFSLLANFNPRTRPVDPTTPTRLNESEVIAEDLQLAGDSNEAEGDFEDERDAELVQRNAQEVRDEKLKSDVFVLKKLNAAFDLFHEALEETGNANQRVAAQIAETDALLNKYINMLSKSEEFARLIFDERWRGAEADEEEYIFEKREEEEKARQAAEEKARKEREEEQRLEREKEERRKKEERERSEREKAERAIRGSVRGVRGTKASNRGTTSSRATATVGPSRSVPKRPPSAGGGSGLPRASYRPS